MSFTPSHIWAAMSLPSKLIAIVLLLMATIAIAVVVERLVAIILGGIETRRFLRAVLPLVQSEEYPKAVELAKQQRSSPFARLVGPVLDKLSSTEEKNLSRIELARREADRQKELVGEVMRRGMGLLASIGSIAPFVGLLGTVIGIISAFQGIAATGSGGLGSVSAGIAEALIETALGLVVAIPSVLAFNQLNTKINAVETEVARRTGELLDELENNHGSRDSGRFEKAA
jgi:biopolymer transport protein ExbB